MLGPIRRRAAAAVASAARGANRISRSPNSNDATDAASQNATRPKNTTSTLNWLWETLPFDVAPGSIYRGCCEVMLPFTTCARPPR